MSDTGFLYEDHYADATHDAYEQGYADGMRDAVKHGKWILMQEKSDGDNNDYRCSVCHHGDTHVPSAEVPYCWYCGAKMDIPSD